MTYFETPTDKFAHDHGMTEDEVVRMMDDVIDESLFPEYGPGDEDAPLVPENDVLNADEEIVWGYGGDDRRIIPAANG